MQQGSFVIFCAAISHAWITCHLIAADPVFTDQTIPSGLIHTHSTVQVSPALENMAAGGAVGDFDRDGDQDIFIIGGSNGVDMLYINDGTGNFTDQAASWGVQVAHRGTGAAVADYDNDGVGHVTRDA